MTRARNKPNDKPQPGAIGYGILPELIGYRVRLAQVAIFRDFCTRVGDAEITPTLFGVLVLVDANPGMMQTQLANAMHLDRSSVVSILDKLEGKQVLERVRSPDNRRSNALHLTDKGRQWLSQLLPEVRAHEQRLTSRLGPDELATLRDLLDRLGSGLRG
ncbi:MarR family winged helix-turn-helix transcriptional regulator [Rhodocyclaceae bacterium SMB388]